MSFFIDNLSRLGMVTGDAASYTQQGITPQKNGKLRINRYF